MKMIVGLMMAVYLVTYSSITQTPEAEEAAVAGPKNSISDVMKKAHGGQGLMKKAVKGEATEEELKELIGLYVDMLDNEPPKGELEDWQNASTQVLVAATRLMLGQEGADELLQKATNCKACHDAHK